MTSINGTLKFSRMGGFKESILVVNMAYIEELERAKQSSRTERARDREGAIFAALIGRCFGRCSDWIAID